MPQGTLVFDIETHSQDRLYSMPPEEFVRLIGYKWLGGEVVLTTDLEELKAQIREARCVIGHNIHAFDLRAVFGYKSDEPLQLAQEGRVYDTWTHAILVNPAPHIYVDRFGKSALGDEPKKMKKWFGLDEQAHQLGVTGKTADLKALALEFGNPLFTGKARLNDGFGKIPVDDERYRAYLIGDVLASEAVAKALLKLGPLNAYALREQEIAARAAVISSNGFRVDVSVAQARVDELAARREEIMKGLVEKYDFPTEGDAPWASDEGKRAILAALADHGVTPETRPDWPKTPVWEKRSLKIAEVKAKAKKLEAKVNEWKEEVRAGELPERSLKARRGWIEREEAKIREMRADPLPVAFGLSLGGQELIQLTEDTGAQDLGLALAELKGQRSLAQLALDSVHPDGFAHPEITMLQRSGRWSTTEPGLTVWTSRGDNAIEKAYFIPDNEDEVLLEIDYSNADARVVAAYSGDRKFAERFEPGADGHMINALAAWGEEVVETDPGQYRQKAKALGHGWNYGGQAKTLSQQAGLPIETAKTFCDGMNSTYSRLVSWQNFVRKEAQRGYVINHWGRRMPVEKGREFTQAPALMGQSGTREIVCDALLRMPVWALRRVKAQIHDAVVFSVPKATFNKWVKFLVETMEDTFDPGSRGQLIEFPVEAGPPGANWYLAAHG